MEHRNTNQCAVPALLGIAVLLSLVAARPAEAIDVEVNGRPIHFADARPVQVNGRVLIPLRHVAESLGAVVRWDAASRTVSGSRGDRSFTLPIGSRTAFVKGEPVRLDTPASVRFGRTMVPLRFVAEALGADVAWHAAQRLVSVDLGGARVAGQRESRTLIPAETIVRVRLDDDVSSETARVGDRVTTTVDEDDRSRFPSGTKLEGRITQVQRATKDRPGIIDMAFDQAVLPDGESVRISGSLTSLHKDHIQRTDDGREASRRRSEKKFDWKWVGIGAAGGAVLGEVFGDNLLRGALIGAVGGAVYSYLKKGRDKDEFRNVELAQGTEFGVRLNRQVAFADRDTFRNP